MSTDVEASRVLPILLNAGNKRFPWWGAGGATSAYSPEEEEVKAANSSRGCSSPAGEDTASSLLSPWKGGNFHSHPRRGKRGGILSSLSSLSPISAQKRRRASPWSLREETEQAPHPFRLQHRPRGSSSSLGVRGQPALGKACRRALILCAELSFKFGDEVLATFGLRFSIIFSFQSYQ